MVRVNLLNTAMNTYSYKDCKICINQSDIFSCLPHCSTLRQKTNLGIKSRILSSAWVFRVVFVLSPRACNMNINLIMVSGGIPGQSLISFN